MDKNVHIFFPLSKLRLFNCFPFVQNHFRFMYHFICIVLYFCVTERGFSLAGRAGSSPLEGKIHQSVTVWYQSSSDLFGLWVLDLLVFRYCVFDFKLWINFLNLYCPSSFFRVLVIETKYFMRRIVHRFSVVFGVGKNSTEPWYICI